MVFEVLAMDEPRSGSIHCGNCRAVHMVVKWISQSQKPFGAWKCLAHSITTGLESRFQRPAPHTTHRSGQPCQHGTGTEARASCLIPLCSPRVFSPPQLSRWGRPGPFEARWLEA